VRGVRFESHPETGKARTARRPESQETCLMPAERCFEEKVNVG
jgi:hypothetical protein